MKAELEAVGCRLEAGRVGYGHALHDLDIWNRAMVVAEQVYRLTDTFPSEERFGLVAQMRRAAVSVPSNIAEGHGHGRGKACATFSWHARGSLSEIKTQIMLSIRLGFLEESQASAVIGEMDVLHAQLMRFIIAQEES